ncbi:hypothetical protein B5C26_11035 [Photorhabdus luminescens]|nr:hypothetical protein B5C26_11035 [Photorhabdus luminescens]
MATLCRDNYCSESIVDSVILIYCLFHYGYFIDFFGHLGVLYNVSLFKSWILFVKESFSCKEELFSIFNLNCLHNFIIQ